MNSKPPRPHRWIVLVAIVAYLALVAVATLGPPSIAGGVFDLVVRLTGGAMSPRSLEFAANIAMFVPLGFLFVLFLGPRQWAWALVVGALLTLGIEGVQMVIPGRVPDVRDLIANGSGAVVGVVLGYLAVQPRRRVLRSLTIVGALLVGGVVAASTVVGQPPALAESSPVGRQLDYVAAHWSDRNVTEYGSLDDTDCVNFASQSLIARGWTQSDEWWHSNAAGVHSYSPAWISSGAMASWLAGHPELAESLDDSQRAAVALGDIVQFDWDDNGTVDHTGIVNRIETDDTATRIYYASHSNDRESQSVDVAIERDGRGGAVSYWHLAA
jgi:VanZ family protein